MSYSLDDIVARTNKLASLPAIYNELKAAIDNPDSDIDEITSIIKKDPDISARMIGLANSSLYSFGGNVSNISRVVMLIGTRQLHDLILATVVISQFKSLSIQGLDMKSFWSHSIACGIAARNIATWLREPNIEKYYITALLHDLGRLMLFLQEPEVMQRLLEEHLDSKVALHILESQTLGFDNAKAGSQLLTSWGFPLSLSEPIHFQNQPSKSMEEFALNASVIHLADLIANAMKLGTSGQKYIPQLDIQALQRCELPTSVLPEIVSRTQEQQTDAVKLFLAA